MKYNLYLKNTNGKLGNETRRTTDTPTPSNVSLPTARHSRAHRSTEAISRVVPPWVYSCFQCTRPSNSGTKTPLVVAVVTVVQVHRQHSVEDLVNRDQKDGRVHEVAL